MSDNRHLKVAILYRVVQEWRRPVFERLHEQPGMALKIFHGPDFPGTKVVSSKKPLSVPTRKLWSFQLKKESKNGLIAMPISPLLLFDLIRYRPDVVVTEGASNLFNAIVGFIYCKLFKKKYIWWSLGRLSGTVHSGFRKKIDVLIQFLEKRSDSIISYSSLGKRYFESIGIPSKKIFVAVNVVDTAKKLEVLTKIEDRSFVDQIRGDAQFVVLFVGAFTAQKKLDLLVNAFNTFQKKANNSKLILVGDGPEKSRIESLVRAEKISNVQFTGRVFNGVERYFLSSDTFVLPGLGGLAVSEALLYGVPVIASIGDGCEKDLIDSGVNGIIDEALNKDRLVSYLFDLYSNPDKLESFRSEATRTIREKHNIESYLGQVVAAIKS
jgi:glycosyltransferase involved in cell wall biosynthesis